MVDNAVMMALVVGAGLSLAWLFGTFADVAGDMIKGGIVMYEPNTQADFSAKFISVDGREVNR